MEQERQAYDQILKLLKKHEGLCVFYVPDLERKANAHLFGLELKHQYGLNINPKDVQANNYYKPKDYHYICWFGEKHNRQISWSVDGRQPEDELLLEISFPTGAYIFGEDYPTELFQDFWLSLKSYSPDYIDEVNHCLFWKIDNAKGVFNSFDDTIKKYHDLNKVDSKQRKIKKLKEELEKLDN